MKLLTQQLERRFAEVGSQEDQSDPIIIAKFYTPDGAGVWYFSAYLPKDRLFFGYGSVFGDWNEDWGNFSLDELEEYRSRSEVEIERDLDFQEQPSSRVINKKLW